MTTEASTPLSNPNARTFVGRAKELARLREALNDAGPVLCYVHGIAGVGKSALLAEFARLARNEGATVVTLDCRTIEPTERGFLESLAAASGSTSSDLEAVSQRLESLGARVVLSLDAYEVFRFLDAWLRETFLPSLAATVRLVLAGREPPVLTWLTEASWQGRVQVIALDALPESDALGFLQANGVVLADALRLNRFAHGNPLALRLAAATMSLRSDVNLYDEAIPQAVDTLARLYLSEVDDALTRQSLIAAAAVRRVTKSLLRSMLPQSAPDDVFDRLAALPFVSLASDGLFLHDAVRESIGAHTRAVDPETYRSLRRAAWSQLRAEVKTAGPSELWRYTADVLYLLQNEAIHEAFFPSDAPHFTLHMAAEVDHEAIVAIVGQHEGPDSEKLVRRWLKAHPASFFVAKDSRGEVCAFYSMFLYSSADDELISQDPITCGWKQHVDSHPLPPGQTTLFIRYRLSATTGEMPSAEGAACLMDIKRTYMALRPHLRRVYIAQRSPAQAAYQGMTDGFGFETCGTAWLDDQYHLNVNDFGPESVDGWLAKLVARELGMEPGRVLDKLAHELITPSGRVPLTRLEFGLFEYLVNREGQAVTREALMRDVWEQSYAGGSNVIEVVVRSLRKKLGTRADCISTVSGVGYRYRAPAQS
jgi:hypothetical protein